MNAKVQFLFQLRIKNYKLRFFNHKGTQRGFTKFHKEIIVFI